MATPTADTYTATAGTSAMYCGRFSPANNLLALTGDSMNEATIYQVGVGGLNWALGLLGGKWDCLCNTALSGQSIPGVLTQLQHLSTDTYPGWADLPTLGLGLVGIGTLPARYGITVAGFTSAIDDLIAYMLTRCERVGILAIPPFGGVSIEPNQAAAIATFNNYYQLKAAQNPTRVFYIDDCINIRDTDGSILPQYFAADEGHTNGLGSYQKGVDLAAALQALMTSWGGVYPDPVLNDPTNVYPAHNQWLPNPTNIGTGGSKGAGWTGTVVNSITVASNGAGVGGTCYIEAAAPGDPNQDPWQCIAPTSWQAGSNIDIYCQSAGRAYTSGDPVRFKQSIQWQFVDVDSTKFAKIRMWMQDASLQKVTAEHSLNMGESYVGTTINETITMVQRWLRKVPAASGAGLARIYINAVNTGSGSCGVFKFRGWQIEG